MKATLARTLLAATLLAPATGALAGEASTSGAVAAAPSEGGTCSASQTLSSERAEMLARLAAKLQEAQAAQPPGDVVVLNGRGYRYDSDALPAIVRDLQILDIEARRARAAKQAQQPQP